MIRLIELFAGVGTQYYAFSQYEEIKSIGISEIDNKPLKAYKELFGEPNNFGDITKIKTLPESDIWTYSFPCTDLSIGGKQEGFKGKNSSLIYEVYRLLLTSHKPKVLLMENVSNIANKKFMPSFQEWIDSLNKLGYKSFWKKMKACDYGGGTVRDRIFMVSILNCEKDFIFPNEQKTTKTVRDYLEPALPQFKVDEYFFYNCEKSFSKTIKIKDYKNGGQGNRIYSIDGQGITLTATGGGKGGSSGLYLRDEGVYKLSGLEMAKIMGWPRELGEKMCSVLTDREMGFCMGNAIDVKVLSLLAKEIIEQIFEEKSH